MLSVLVWCGRCRHAARCIVHTIAAAAASVRVHVQAAAVLVGGRLTLRASVFVVLVDASGPW